MALQVGRLFALLGLDTSGFDQNVDRAENRFTRLGNSMSNIGKKMTTYVTLPILGIGAAMAKSAIDANEMMNVFNVAFKDSAKGVEDWAAAQAKALGVSKVQFMEASGQMKVLFNTMGLVDEQGTELAKGFTTLAADLASFYNTTESDALEKLRSGLIGEAEPMRAFGVLLNETSVKAKAYEMGIAAVGAELTEQQKVQARAALIMEQTTQAQGDLARTSESTANQIKTLKNRIKDMSVEMGQKLLPIVDRLVSALNSLVTWFTNLSPAAQNMIMIFAAIAAALGPIVFVVGKIITLVGWLQAAWAVIAPFVTGVLIPAITALAAALGLPVWALVALVAAVVAAVVAIVVYWDEIKAATIAVWTAIANFFTETIPALVKRVIEWFKQLPDRIVQFLSELPAKVAYWIGFMAGTLVRLILNMVQKAIQLWNWLKTEGVKKAGEMVTGAINFIKNLPSAVWNLITQMANRVRQGFTNAANWAKTAASNLVNGVRTIISNLPSIFTNIFNKVISYVSGLPGRLYEKAKSIASSFWNGFKQGLGIHSPSFIEKAFSAIGAKANDTVSQLKSLTPHMRSAVEGMTPAFAGDLNNAATVRGLTGRDDQNVALNDKLTGGTTTTTGAEAEEEVIPVVINNYTMLDGKQVAQNQSSLTIRKNRASGRR